MRDIVKALFVIVAAGANYVCNAITTASASEKQLDNIRALSQASD